MKRAHLVELVALTLLAAAAATIVPLSTGYFAWSWDALNHHIYLGMTAESPRWQLDVIPASYQTYQYPYLYWPVYRLSLLDGSGAVVGAVWSAFQAAMLLPPLWWICYRLLPDTGTALQGRAERAAGCVLAFMSVIVLIGLETTANDLLASVPLLWAVAVSLKTPPTDRRAMVAAGLWGVSAAFKLSNGIFLPLLFLWWWVPSRPHWPWRRAVALAFGGALGFAVPYAPWGWQLWQVTGNPFYPFLGALFGRA
jgi:hypothetical protein